MTSEPEYLQQRVPQQDRERYDALLRTLDNVPVLVRDFMAAHEKRPTAGSIGALERETYAEPDAVVMAQAQGTAAIEVTFDHLGALERCLQEPILPFPMWTATRGLLEAAAQAQWLLDPEIDASTRVGRSMALRHRGLEQQLRMASHGDDAETILRAKDALQKLVVSAERRGVHIKRKAQQVTVVHEPVRISDLIEEALQAADDYRRLSAVAHSEMWALIQVGFQVPDEAPSDQGERFMTKAFDFDGALYLSVSALYWLFRPLWSKTLIYGWDRAHFARLAEPI